MTGSTTGETPTPCTYRGAWTGKPCTRSAGHSGIHVTWSGPVVVAQDAPIVQSPFTRAALAGRLPAKIVR